MISLNLIKPITRAQLKMAKKCGWKNLEDIAEKQNIISENFARTAKSVSEPITIGTKLNSSNFEVLETIMGDNKFSQSPFIKTNLTELLKFGNNYKGKRLLKVLLKPENIDKIETQRHLVRRNPKEYIKDKDVVNYMRTPAGLNSLFNDINILKAAAILDAKSFDSLFKMDITTGQGKKILDTIGNMEEPKLTQVKYISDNSKCPENALEYLKIEANLKQA